MNSAVAIDPASETELSDIIRSTTGPLTIQGGGTRGIPVHHDVLTTRRMAGVTLYDPGTLTMVARSGTPLKDIQATLAKENQILAFEPFDMSSMTGPSGISTIGGVFATNASGPRRFREGAARDFLLGVRFVDGAGQIIKNGGRVMKNVTGYDLTKLLAGSFGRLGVLTEVSFKVLPKPQSMQTLAIAGTDIPTALLAMKTAVNAPYEVSGAVHLCAASDVASACTYIRIEGLQASVRRRCAKLKAILSAFGSVTYADPTIWQRFEQLAFFDAPVRSLWNVGVRPSRAADFIASLDGLGRFDFAVDWAGARIWVGSQDGMATNDCDLHRHLQARARTLNGFANLVYSTNAAISPRFQPEGQSHRKLTETLRKQFDPRLILNTSLSEDHPNDAQLRSGQ